MIYIATFTKKKYLYEGEESSTASTENKKQTSKSQS